MNGVNIRLSNMFDAIDMFSILDEAELIVAPVRISCPMNARDRETEAVSGNDFDDAYNNSTGVVEKNLPRIAVCVIAPSCAYDRISGPHYVPFYSEGSVFQNNNVRDSAVENSARHQIVVAIENLAMMLTVMGREVFVPIGPYSEPKAPYDVNKEEQTGINMSLVNRSILPGYWCYPYKPGYRFHKIECVFPKVIRDQGNSFIDPIDDIAVAEVLSKKTPTDAGDEYSSKLKKLSELYKQGNDSKTIDIGSHRTRLDIRG